MKLKSKSLFLDEDTKIKPCQVMNKKVKIHSAAFYYQLSRIFYVPSLSKKMFSYIERCFTMLVETKSFVELDFSSVSRILASSSLQIDSEVEVYNSINKWLSYNIEERGKFAKQLLFYVRLNLLSDHCLNNLLKESTCISMNDACIEVLKNRNKKQIEPIYRNKRRYYGHSNFNIVICGGLSVSRGRAISNVKRFNENMNKRLLYLPTMIAERYSSKAVYLKGAIYVFGGFDRNHSRIKSVEKYSLEFKRWKVITNIPDNRQHFCACAFIDNIYIFGGSTPVMYFPDELSSCLQFDTKQIKWKKVADMTKLRKSAACAIFEEHIVVSGGYSWGEKLNTVESYDVFAGTWTRMPSMNERISEHSLVCVKSKLFAIGGLYSNISCEVFDKISNVFVKLKSPKLYSRGLTAVSIGSKIFVLNYLKQFVLCYNVDNNDWSETSCKAIEGISEYTPVRVLLY